MSNIVLGSIPNEQVDVVVTRTFESKEQQSTYKVGYTQEESNAR